MRNTARTFGLLLIILSVGALLLLWYSGSGRLEPESRLVTGAAGLIGFTLLGTGLFLAASKPPRRMKSSRPSGTVERHARNSAVVATISLVALGFGIYAAMQSNAPRGMGGLLVFGLIAAAISVPYFFVCLNIVGKARAMRSGQTAIARWTVPPEEFARWRDIDQRFTERGEPGIYGPPHDVHSKGVEVIFSREGVLIGGSFFPLKTTGPGRIVTSTRFIASNPPTIEFNMLHKVRVGRAPNTSTQRTFGTLRVPVAGVAASQGEQVAHHYQRAVVDMREAERHG